MTSHETKYCFLSHKTQPIHWAKIENLQVVKMCVGGCMEPMKTYEFPSVNRPGAINMQILLNPIRVRKILHFLIFTSNRNAASPLAL